MKEAERQNRENIQTRIKYRIQCEPLCRMARRFLNAQREAAQWRSEYN